MVAAGAVVVAAGVDVVAAAVDVVAANFVEVRGSVDFAVV